MSESLSALLPWSWAQKVADFQKPDDPVFFAREGVSLASALAAAPDDSYRLVLSPSGTCTEEDYHAVHRVLQKDGFFLTQQYGGEDCRRLAQFLRPGSAAASAHNVEHHLPLLRDAGFRVMFRDQAYPVQALTTPEELTDFLTQNPHRFAGLTQEQLQQKQPELEALLQRDGAIPVERHVFLLIGKKR